MFSGSIVALITPLTHNGIDESALNNLIRFHIDNGTDGIVPVGTTGEAPTLSKKENERVIEIVTHAVGGQIPVIAGAGSNNTADAIIMSQFAAQVGADATLHVMGYYNRPHQEGIWQHFEALDGATDIPILVYNIPARAVVDITPETMARLASLPAVVGVKDATRDLARPLIERQLIDGEFCFLSGEDPTAVAYNANGGVGCISVSANVAPRLCAQVQEACRNQQFDIALQLHRKLMPLHNALFLEPSPAGVKYACSQLGLSTPYCRLPIVELSEGTKVSIDQALKELELL